MFLIKSGRTLQLIENVTLFKCTSFYLWLQIPLNQIKASNLFPFQASMLSLYVWFPPSTNYLL